MTVRLRPANKVDVPVIAELIRGLARLGQLVMPAFSERWNPPKDRAKSHLPTTHLQSI